MMLPFLFSTSKLTCWIKFQDFESKNDIFGWISCFTSFKQGLIFDAIGDKVLKSWISSAIFMSIFWFDSWIAQNGVIPPTRAIPTIPSGTGSPKISLPSSLTASTPPIPILLSLLMMSIAFCLPIPGISLKFAGMIPVPLSTTSRTDVNPGVANASNGVTDVFLYEIISVNLIGWESSIFRSPPYCSCEGIPSLSSTPSIVVPHNVVAVILLSFPTLFKLT